MGKPNNVSLSNSDKKAILIHLDTEDLEFVRERAYNDERSRKKTIEMLITDARLLSEVNKMH